jgi:hypothetical protein
VKHFASLACVALFACGGNEATKQVAPSTSSPTPGSAQAPVQAAQGSTPEAPLELGLRVERSNDGLGLHVINRGAARVSLAAEVALERRTGERYAAVAGKALALRFDCKSQGCVELAPGAELVAPSWLGRADGERCGALVQLTEIGSYRFVVKSCGGQQASDVRFEQSTPP